MLEDQTENMDDAAGEQYPNYPYNPEIYNKAGDDDPEKKWFINRGAEYRDGAYVGGFGTRP